MDRLSLEDPKPRNRQEQAWDQMLPSPAVDGRPELGREAVAPLPSVSTGRSWPTEKLPEAWS